MLCLWRPTFNQARRSLDGFTSMTAQIRDSGSCIGQFGSARYPDGAVRSRSRSAMRLANARAADPLQLPPLSLCDAWAHGADRERRCL